jgi:putative colanic acid biosynthesis acetyltransferase WcaF
MEKINLDIGVNRTHKNYSKKVIVERILWAFAYLFFRFSPRNFFEFRNALLRLFGAQIGKHVHIYNSAQIYMPWNLEIGDWSAIGEYAFIYNLGKVMIGSRTTVSQRAHICAGTHDYHKRDLPLLKLPVQIGDDAWICADAFVGPNVVVGDGAVVGARAVVVKDVEPWTVVAGNPARFIKKREIN